MEKPCFSVTTLPESAILLYTQNTRKGHTGYLASLASLRCGQYGQSNRVCEVILRGLADW
jgi:hypothetical protein